MKPPQTPSVLHRSFSCPERLEARIAPAIFTVTSAADSGLGTLRQAILDANAHAGSDEIHFSLPQGTLPVITVLSPLPAITETLSLDGSTQPGPGSTAKIILYGSSTLPANTDGLVISGWLSRGSFIRGISITGFPGDGLEINHSEAVTVVKSAFGIAPSVQLPGNGGSGIRIISSSSTYLGSSISGDGLVVSGNGRLDSTAAQIFLSVSTGTVILNSKIGTDFTGLTSANPNYPTEGITINGGSATFIGDISSGNIISGNGGHGIQINGSPSTVIYGNIIGLGSDGRKILENGGDGIRASNSSLLSIGRMGPGAGNIISGNRGSGIYVSGVQGQPSGLEIAGNTIGANIDGVVITGGSKPSQEPGQYTGNLRGIVLDNVIGATIGGAFFEGGNLISGNGNRIFPYTPTSAAEAYFGGIVLYNSTSCTIIGNSIGTDVTGTKAAGNQADGIRIVGGMNHVIGGAWNSSGNLISANGGTTGANRGYSSGIAITDASNIKVIGNKIGTDITGTKDLGNARDGIVIDTINGTAGQNIVGGSTPAERNVISGNDRYGIRIGDLSNQAKAVVATSVRGNYIGTDVTGILAVPNAWTGISLSSKSSGALISANVVSGNGGTGIVVNGDSHQITKNLIGLDATGSKALGNKEWGLLTTSNSRSALISENVISANGANWVRGLDTNPPGVDLDGADHTLQGNIIGLDAKKVSTLGNYRDGIAIRGYNITIQGEKNPNIIAGNQGVGIWVTDTAFNIKILSNLIGLAGQQAFGNNGGIYVGHISGLIKIEGNEIAGNTGSGITAQDAKNLEITGNWIGLARKGLAAIPNHGNGISIYNNRYDTSYIIKENTISGNVGNGIYFLNTSTTATKTPTTITGNNIGSNSEKTIAIPNGENGISITGFLGSITIGGLESKSSNLITANGQNGIFLDSPSGYYPTALKILGNTIGSIGNLPGNNGDGIQAKGKNVALAVGDGSIGGRNTIRGNGENGVEVSGVKQGSIVIAGNLITNQARALGKSGSGIHLAQIEAPIHIAGNTIAGNSYQGILFYPTAVSGGFTVTGNLIGKFGEGNQGNGGNGIFVSGSLALDTDKFEITNNRLGGNGRQEIFLVNLDFSGPAGDPARQEIVRQAAIITGNRIGTAATDGEIRPSAAGISLNRVQYLQVGAEENPNVIAGITGNAIEADVSSYLKIGGNQIGLANSPRHSVGTGIMLAQGIENCFVGFDPESTAGSGANLIAGFKTSGISLYGNHTIIAGNDLPGGTGPSIMASGQFNQIHHNEISNAGGIVAGNLSDSVIRKNSIQFNTGNGITLAQGERVGIEENTLHGGSGHGVVLGTTSESILRATVSQNSISGYTGNGISVLTGTSTLDRNLIFNNGGLAVDLKNDGPTANDALDADGGPNGLQNYAVLETAYVRRGEAFVRGEFAGAPLRTLRVEFFTYATSQDGETHVVYAASTLIRTNAAGRADVAMNVPAVPGSTIGATVTDTQTGATSEYSYLQTQSPLSVIAVGTVRGQVGTAELLSIDRLDGAPLLHVQPYGPKFRGGLNVTHADVNQDGVEDLVVAPQTGSQPVRVFNGLNGELLASWETAPKSFTRGITVAAGDTDGDGIAEIITAYGRGGSPRVIVHDALTGAVESSFLAAGASSRTGINLAAGDLDGDGRAEIVTGTASGNAVVKTFHADGTSYGKTLRPFSSVFSLGARVAVYQASPDTAPFLAIGSGAGLRSTVAFLEPDGDVAAPSLRILHGKVGVGVSVATTFVNDGESTALIATLGGDRRLELRLGLELDAIAAMPLLMPNKSVNIG